MKVITIPNTNTLGYWAYLAIQQHFLKTIKYERDVIEDKDPEDRPTARRNALQVLAAMANNAPKIF